MKDIEKVELAQPELTPKQLKKAAKRAALIQEIAEAVYNYERQKSREWSEANKEKPVLIGPFVDAFDEHSSKEWAKERAKKKDWERSYETERVLNWAKKNGLLPESATELPSEEIQRYLLAERITHAQVAQ